MNAVVLGIDPGALLAPAAFALTWVLGLGAVATLVWSPVLAYSRVRSLFRHLPLTGSPAGNYLMVALGLSWPWLVPYGYAFLATTKWSVSLGEAYFLGGVVLWASYVVGLPFVAGVVLPQRGVDWDPKLYGLGTWVVLLVTCTWYATVYVAGTFVIAILTFGNPM